MISRKNRSTKAMPKVDLDPAVDLSPTALATGSKRFENWHWGIGPARVLDWNDPDYPKMLVECGRLIRLHVRAPDNSPGHPGHTHPRRKRDTMIELSRTASECSHVAFDPEHTDERLYLLVEPKACETLGKRFWHENDFRPMDLNSLAAIAGGRHGKRADYPKIMVKPVGVLTAVVYYTHKKGDENPGNPRSFYIHAVGELSSHYPILCCDERGRLWLAGGNYRSPDPGITD